MRAHSYFKSSTLGINGQYTVTIISTPAGTPVSGSTNTFDYPILSNVTLKCMVDPSPPASATYRWNTACYTNARSNDQTCFPHDQTTQSVTGTNLLAEDAGSVVCSVTINDNIHSSNFYGVRVSGIHFLYLCITSVVKVERLHWVLKKRIIPEIMSNR